MSIYIILGAARANFTLEKKLAMLNVLNSLKKKRQGIGASCSVFLHYLHPEKFISVRYTNKDKFGALVGITISWREVIIVTRREQC